MTKGSTDDNGGTPRLLSISNVADILDVSTRTVQRLMRSLELPAYRFGGTVRIAENDLKKFLRKHRGCRREKRKRDDRGLGGGNDDDENDESD
jgi:excisionase family DNA binding protein